MAATTPTKKRMMQLNFLDTCATGPHVCLGQWKNPQDSSRIKDRLDYYVWMAKLAEKGKITSIFFADTYGVHETYGGHAVAAFKGGSFVATLDPVAIVSAMAYATKSVSFGITGNTSYLTPYILARTWSTLDHITNGRIGWNVVTGFGNSAAKCMGKDEVVPHDERYLAAEEYIDLVYQLWERSWEDGAQVWIEEPEMAYDPSKIHRIEFKGKYHKFSGYGQTHPSPQRTPTIFQAGASSSGTEFAGKHSEGIYCAGPTPDVVLRHATAVRAAAKRHGRDPSTVKLFAGITPIIGRTFEEAQAKYDLAKSKVSAIAGLAAFCGFSGVDLSTTGIDEPFHIDDEQEAKSSIQGVFKNFKIIEKDKAWTPRLIGEELAFPEHFMPAPVGTAESVADFMIKWMEEADIDGFNLQYVSNPGSFEDIVELLVPELQRRGVYWEDYPVPGGTFRENMQDKPGERLLPSDHPGARCRWNAKGPEEATLEVVNGEVNGHKADDA